MARLAVGGSLGDERTVPTLGTASRGMESKAPIVTAVDECLWSQLPMQYSGL